MVTKNAVFMRSVAFRKRLVANTKREGNTVSVTVDHPQYHPSVMVHGMTGVAIQTELEVNYTDKGVI